MEKNTTEIDDLKKMWKEMNLRLSRLEEETRKEGHRVCETNVRSAQQDLASTYKRMAMLCGGMVVIYCPLLAFNTEMFNYPDTLSRIIAAVSLGVFFLIGMVMDIYLYSGVMDINLADMSVREVRQRAIRLKKFHHIFQMILMPLAITVLIIMCYPLCSNRYVLEGVILGGVIGILIGIRIYCKIIRDYREMINS